MPDVSEEIQEREDLDAQVETLLGEISQTAEQVRRQQRGEGSSTALDVAPAAAVTDAEPDSQPEADAAGSTPAADAIEPDEPLPEARAPDPQADPSPVSADEQEPTAAGGDERAEVIADEGSAVGTEQAGQTGQADEPRSDQSGHGEPAPVEEVARESDAPGEEDESLSREVDQLLAGAATATDADEADSQEEGGGAVEAQSVPGDDPAPEDIESLDEVLAGNADDLDEADLAVNPESDEPIAAELGGIDGEFESIDETEGEGEALPPAPAATDTGRKPMPPGDEEGAQPAPAATDTGQRPMPPGEGEASPPAPADEPGTHEAGTGEGASENGQADPSGRLARVRVAVRSAGVVLTRVGRWVLPRLATGAERSARVLSSPLAGKPRIWRDSVGWVALNTLFWALVVWMNTLFLRQADPPPKAPAPSAQVHEP